MSKRNFDNYFQFFQTLKTMVQPPDLMIYLKCSVPTLVSQILIIDCDKNKFSENEEHFGEIISKVDSMLFGLF